MTLLAGIEIILLVVAAFYCIVILGLALGIGRLKYAPQAKRPFVSVIVAARNEEQTIGDLLNALLAQEYPSFEIIVVNDRSADRTGQIIERFQDAQPRVRKLEISSLNPNMPAKKNALSLGIAASKGEILCFTDADCAPPPQWISSLISAFDKDIGLVAGYSPYVSDTPRHNGLFFRSALQSFIRYEEFKGAIWAAGSIGLQRAWLCTGRSLAYRREVFDEVGGFEKIRQSVSGDDDLFLQLVRRTTHWQVRYVTAPESFVLTRPPRTFREFVRQRARHFSAGKFFPLGMKVFFLSYHATNLVLLVSFVEGLASGRSWQAFVPFFAKCIADSLLFARAVRVFRHKEFATTFLVHEFLYVLYNSFIGPLGFVIKFRWKPENQS
jgi:cellulose synthase/poly-beta-1,6-N-acetylglucosamine synthase-like glycosyltransferase